MTLDFYQFLKQKSIGVGAKKLLVKDDIVILGGGYRKQCRQSALEHVGLSFNQLLFVFTRPPQIFSDGSFFEVKYW